MAPDMVAAEFADDRSGLGLSDCSVSPTSHGWHPTPRLEDFSGGPRQAPQVKPWDSISTGFISDGDSSWSMHCVAALGPHFWQSTACRLILLLQNCDANGIQGQFRTWLCALRTQIFILLGYRPHGLHDPWHESDTHILGLTTAHHGCHGVANDVMMTCKVTTNLLNPASALTPGTVWRMNWFPPVFGGSC